MASTASACGRRSPRQKRLFGEAAHRGETSPSADGGPHSGWPLCKEDTEHRKSVAGRFVHKWGGFITITRSARSGKWICSSTNRREGSTGPLVAASDPVITGFDGHTFFESLRPPHPSSYSLMSHVGFTVLLTAPVIGLLVMRIDLPTWLLAAWPGRPLTPCCDKSAATLPPASVPRREAPPSIADSSSSPQKPVAHSTTR